MIWTHIKCHYCMSSIKKVLLGNAIRWIIRPLHSIVDNADNSSLISFRICWVSKFNVQIEDFFDLNQFLRESFKFSILDSSYYSTYHGNIDSNPAKHFQISAESLPIPRTIVDYIFSGYFKFFSRWFRSYSMD